MTTERDGDRNEGSNPFLRYLLVPFGVLSILLVLPFLQPVLAGGLLAYLVYPVSERLSGRFGPNLGVVVTILATVVVILVPLSVLVGVAAEQAYSLLQGTDALTAGDVESAVRPWVGTDVDISGLWDTLSEAARTGISGLLGGILGVLGGIPAFVVGLVIFLFAYYYVLRDGDALLSWLRTAAPLEPAIVDELFERADDLLWAAVIGNVIVAGVQAILTVFAFIVLGFDNIVFLGLATFVLSMLPLIGASVVWIPAAAYLAVTGSVPAAVGLFLYGTVVISGSDNIVRPMAMQRGADLNPGLLVLGIFGGVVVFGFLGLFVGPVLLGLSKAIVDMLVAERSKVGGDT